MEKRYENRLFRADELVPTVYRITQPWFREGALHAYTYLIIGTKAAIVFDTMFGYGNLREFCEEITETAESMDEGTRKIMHIIFSTMPTAAASLRPRRFAITVMTIKAICIKPS